MKISLSAVIALGLAINACSKKNDDDDENSAADLSTASSLIFTINNALSSIPTTSLSLASAMSGNPFCTEHGQPLVDGVTTKKGETSKDADRMQTSDKNYSSRLFMCLSTLSATDGASVETLQGSLSQVASVFCTIEKALGTIEYTKDGTKLVTGDPVKAAMDDSCWPNGTPEGMTEVVLNSGTALLLDESTGYEKELSFISESAGVDYKLRFFNKDGVIGFKTIDQGTSPGIGGYSEMVLDSNKGVVLVNTVDDRNGYGGADSSYRRTVRLQVKGDIDPVKLTFENLTSIQGIHTESGNYSENEEVFTGTTIIGTTSKGYYGTSVSYDGSAFTTNYAGCTGDAVTTCPSSGLVFEDNKFYSSRSDWETHRESGLPPCYDSKDLTFAAVPTTGKFGVCE